MRETTAARRATLIGALICVLALAGHASAFGTPLPAGTDFQVNTYTTGNQYFATTQGRRGIARDAAGNFVVVWVSAGQDGSNMGVFGQRFDRNAARLGTEFQINTYTTGRQGSQFRDDLVQLDVSMAPTGEFVVVWPADDDEDGSGPGIFARRFDASGAALGTEFQVNTYTTGTQEQPAVAHDPSGDFVVTWSSWYQDGAGIGVFGRLFDAQGNPNSSEFPVNTETARNQQLSMVSRNAAGDFVVAWTHQDADYYGYDIHAQRFNAAGAMVGTEIQVNTNTVGRQWFGDVAMDAAGDFVVAWGRTNVPGGAARKFDAAGVPVGTEFQVASFSTEYVTEPSISMTAGGRFLVTWRGYSADRSGILARRFDTNATPVEDEFLVNDYLADGGAEPSAVMDENGSFVVAWDAIQRARDGSGFGVFGRRFCDSADGSCDLCPGYDDSIDDDADGVPNGCDPCTTLEPGQAIESTHLRVAFREPAPKLIPEKADMVRMTGSFVLAGAPGAFATLQPQVDGIRVRIESKDGGQVAELSVAPGSPGWTQLTRAWKFIYDDPTLGNGVRSIVITDTNAKVPNGVKIKIKAASGLYAVGSSYVPLRAIVTLGGTAAADTGLCGEVTFAPDECNLIGPYYRIIGMSCSN